MGLDEAVAHGRLAVTGVSDRGAVGTLFVSNPLDPAGSERRDGCPIVLMTSP